VLFLFLRDARYPVAVALAIPISVVATFSLLDLAGVSLNIMSLGGLALGVGMLVDNSIVVLENVFRHRELGADSLDAAARGADEVRGAITASTLTTISVFAPIIYVEGVAGELFGALSLAVAFALLASLLVALTLLPTMAARWGRVRPGKPPLIRRAVAAVWGPVSAFVAGLSRPLLDWFDRRFARFADWYHGVLGRALDRRGRVVGIAAIGLVGGVALGATLDRDVLPDVDQGAFRVHVTLPRGTPLEETADAAARLERTFLADPAVDAVLTRVGRQDAVAGVEDQESGLNTAVLEVRLKEHAHTAAALERTRPALATFPPGVLAAGGRRGRSRDPGAWRGPGGHLATRQSGRAAAATGGRAEQRASRHRGGAARDPDRDRPRAGGRVRNRAARDCPDHRAVHARHRGDRVPRLR